MSDILPLLLSLQPALPPTNARQLYRIILAMLSLTGRVTQLSLSRWAGKGGSRRTVHRFFQSSISWLEVNWLFFQLYLYCSGATYLLVGDETVVSKSGKKTYGLDRFFSSIVQKPIPGLSFFVYSLVHVEKREAYPLCAEQIEHTPQEKEQARQQREKRKASKRKASGKETAKKTAGRPKGSKNKNKAEVILSPELARILSWGQQVMALIGKQIPVQYLVLDGHFGNHFACGMVRQLGLHLISKMRVNAELYLTPTDEQKRVQPRLKYGARLDYAHLPAALRLSTEEKDGVRTQIYNAQCWHKDFADPINVVIIVKTDLATQRWGHVVLFSSDLALDVETLRDYYSLRFQIEFVFRDAKQHWGLEDFMAVTKASVANAVGLSFFMVDLSAYLLGDLREHFDQAGVNDLKSRYRGQCYAREALKYLPDLPDPIVCEQIFNRVAMLGFIHTEAKSGKIEQFGTNSP